MSSGEKCRCCPLHRTRISVVESRGLEDAEWMIIGEAPGKNEDREGVPFVGRAGKLLDRLTDMYFNRMGYPYITNVVKCRPPRNRDPTPKEIAACWPWLSDQVARVRPKLIVCVGRISAQAVLGTEQPIGTLRGVAFVWRGARVVSTYHPAYALRNPAAETQIMEDLDRAYAQYRDVRWRGAESWYDIPKLSDCVKRM